MIEHAKWRYWLVGLVMALAFLYAVPNLFPQDYAVQVSGIKGAPVDQALQDKASKALAEAGIVPKAVELENQRLLVRFDDDQAQSKALGVIAPALGDSYNVALNLASTVPDWLAALGGRPVTLGLDLQGGVHFLMEVDQEAAQRKVQERTQQAIYSTLREKDVAYRSITMTPGELLVRLDTPADQDKAQTVLATAFTDFTIEEADDTTLRLAFKPEALTQSAASVIEQVTTTMRNRINSLGVAEPVIQRQGNSRIVVQLPGVQDTAAAKRRISATATLEYRAATMTGPQAAAVAQSGRIPPDSLLLYDRDKQPVLVSKELIASGEQLINASDGTDPQSGTPSVSVRLNAAGGARMLDFTSRSVGKPMAVVYVESRPTLKMVDGKEVRSTIETKEIVSVANINGVFSTDFQTTGLGSREEAKELANFLKAGSLAAPLTIVEERVVGPSLGRDNIAAGRDSVVYGFVAIVVFMVIYYKVFGLISVVGLFANLVLLLALLSLLKATMTMPGIAGIALTLGMAIDANVLVNERIREELRNGQTPLASIRAGYEKAWATILDSNMTTLIAGIALFALGSGPIRGFAFVLCLGILTTMFTAITVTYSVVALAYGGKRKLARVPV